MKVTYTFDMDNAVAERCEVTVKFYVDQEGNFDGITRVYSDNPLYHDDLIHLEEFIMQGKENWWVTN